MKKLVIEVWYDDRIDDTEMMYRCGMALEAHRIDHHKMKVVDGITKTEDVMSEVRRVFIENNGIEGGYVDADYEVLYEDVANHVEEIVGRKEKVIDLTTTIESVLQNLGYI